MRKAPLLLLAVSLLWLIVPAASPEAKKKKTPVRPVFTPAAGGEKCTVQGSAVAYRSDKLVALLIPLPPHEEEAFFEEHAGVPMRVFSTSEAAWPSSHSSPSLASRHWPALSSMRPSMPSRW